MNMKFKIKPDTAFWHTPLKKLLPSISKSNCECHIDFNLLHIDWKFILFEDDQTHFETDYLIRRRLTSGVYRATNL